MKRIDIIKNAIEKFAKNELIFASKLYREQLYDKVNEPAFYKVLERMCKSGELMKIAKGTYYLPKNTKHGIVPPSDKDIIHAYTKNCTGTVIGYTLYNSLNLTTQVSKSIQVMSSALEGFTKTIRNITICQVHINYSKSIIDMIHALEVLQNYYNIQDINYIAFVKFAEELAEKYDEKVFTNVISKITYKKSTIAFLQEILDYYGIENNLNVYLSRLSEYKHPKMKEIYELTSAYTCIKI